MQADICPSLACCGLDCTVCAIHTRAEPVLAYFQGQGVDPALVRCDGCLADAAQPGVAHWSEECAIRACALQRGYATCVACAELPCERLTAWATEHDSHARALERLQRLRAGTGGG